MPGRDVKVAFLGDVDSLKRAIDSAERSMNGLEKSVDRQSKSMSNAFKGIGLAAVGAFGALGIAGFAKDAFDAMADTETQTKRVEKVFGSAASKVKGFAKDSAKNLAISNREALRAAGGFGSLFKQLGLGEDQAAQMSLTLLQSGADMAAFAGGDVTEVLETMSAAFRGEYDSLQRFLPTISDAAIKQQAMAMTGKTNADALTDQEKAMAAFALMTSNANPATGAAAANMGTAAWNAAILAANIDDTKVKLADAFGPFLTDVVLKNLNSFADWFKNWWTENGPKFKEGVEEVKRKFGEMRDSADEARKEFDLGTIKVNDAVTPVLDGINTKSHEVWDDWKDTSANVWNWTWDNWRLFQETIGNVWNFFQDTWGGFSKWLQEHVIDPVITLKNMLSELLDLFLKITPGGGAIQEIGKALHLPGFDTGGVVPGPVGAPKLIVAHGGETVLPTHKAGYSRTSNINVEGLTADQALQLIHAYERSQLAGAA